MGRGGHSVHSVPIRTDGRLDGQTVPHETAEGLGWDLENLAYGRMWPSDLTFVRQRLLGAWPVFNLVAELDAYLHGAGIDRDLVGACEWIEASLEDQSFSPSEDIPASAVHPSTAVRWGEAILYC